MSDQSSGADPNSIPYAVEPAAEAYLAVEAATGAIPIVARGAAAAESPASSDVPGARGAGPLSKPWRWLSIGMFSLIFLAAFEVMAVTTVMPIVAADLDGTSLFALAFAVPLAAGILGMVIAGNWTDRSGPLPSLVTAAVLFVVGLLVAGTATDMVVFIVGRLLHGLSGAAVIVPLYVIVGRIYPAQIRARVFAGFAAAWVIPSIVGPALAGVVAEAFSWHWVFLGVIVLVVPAAAMMLVPLLRVRDQVQGDPSVAWSIGRMGWAALTAAAALTLSLSKEAPEPWSWAIAVASIVLVVVAARPLLPPGTFRARRGMPATVLVKMIAAGAFFGSEIYLPYLFIEEYEFSPSLAGAVLTGAGISWALGSWLQGRLTDSVSNAAAVQIGTALIALALLVVFGVAVFHWTPAIAFIAWTGAGAGMGFMWPRFTVAVLELSPVSAQGFNSAALTVAESIGASVALALTAIAAATLASDPAGGIGAFSAEFAVTVAIAVVAVALASRVRPRA